ncbi:MAG: cation:proton antiporter [Thermoplasmata archaeon]|nr:cation:proton antiporter [Thermoplasmata archaeon]
MTLLEPGDYYVLLEVFIFLALAQVVHTLTRRVGLPEIIGDLVVGITVGTYAIGGLIDHALNVPLFGINAGLLLFADFSVVLLLFAAGLGGGFTSLRNAGRLGVLAAIVGDLVPFGLALVVFSRFYPLQAALLLSVAAAATSAAVAASFLRAKNLGRTTGGQFLMNVAAMDDVVALVLLSIVLATVGGSLNLFQLTGTVGTSVLAWIILLLVAVFLFPRVLRVRLLREVESLPFALLFATVAVVLALGFSPVIGAFIAGLAVAESVAAPRTRELSAILLAVFGSLFFIVVGTEFDVHLLVQPGLILVALALAAIAAFGKVIGVYPFALAHLRSSEKASAVAAGMIPRGEIGLIVGAIGLSLGILSPELLGAVVLMAILTTLAGALLFRWLSPSLEGGSSTGLV